MSTPPGRHGNGQPPDADEFWDPVPSGPPQQYVPTNAVPLQYPPSARSVQNAPSFQPLPARQAKLSALPVAPTEYPQMLRTPRYRWWRALLAIALFAGFLVVSLVLVFVAALILGAIFDFPAIELIEQVSSPFGFAVLAITLIVLIPISLFSIRIAFGTRPGYVSSVTGRFRLNWALRCAAVVSPVWIALMVISYLGGDFTGGRPVQWIALMIMVLTLIPFQAAGEEFAFRGFVQQVVGAWFSNRWLALIVPAVLSVPLFAAAHGSFDAWVLADLSASAAAWVYLTWRTGGLEAGIAVHAVNNCSIMLTSLVFGGFENGFVTDQSTGSWQSLAITLVCNALAVVLIVWQARRVGLQRLFEPALGQPEPAPELEHGRQVGPVAR